MSKKTREIVMQRADSRCELCGAFSFGFMGYSFHHRKPRGMGGTKNKKSEKPSNIILLCGSGTTGCHGRVESMRDWSRDNGILVCQSDDPLQVKIKLLVGWCHLLDDGSYVTTGGVYPILKSDLL